MIDPESPIRIAFFGLYSSFDFYQIGGCESYVRRLALQLSLQGHQVDYVLVGSSKTKTVQLEKWNIRLRYYGTIREACEALLDSYDCVVTVYLPFFQRLYYTLFRFKHRDHIVFDLLLFGLPCSPIKRFSYLLDACLFYHRVWAVSPRVERAIKRLGIPSKLLLPPVPSNYFVHPEEKPERDRIKIMFAGRVDKGKGIEEVIELFSMLTDSARFELEIHGYYNPKSDTADSQGLYEWLKNQCSINYIDTDQAKYSVEIEDRLRCALRETDILVLPYRDLGSTIDTPMLLLEGMASLCAIVTRRLGDIPKIYGESEFVIGKDDELARMVLLLLEKGGFKKRLLAERDRLYRRMADMRFSAEEIAREFSSDLLDRIYRISICSNRRQLTE